MSIYTNLKKRIAAAAAALFTAFICCSDISVQASVEVDETDLKTMAEKVIVLLNEARTEAGLEPVFMVPYLCDMAMVRSREIIFNFAHQRPETNEKFITVVDTNLVPYSRAAENIAAGSDTPEAVFEQWKNSSAHWSAMMNPDYTHIGVGVAYDSNSDYKWYWEQLFIATSKTLDGQSIPERYKTVPASSGDINGDESINSFDVITINQYLAGNIKYLNDLQVDSADLLKDGIITSSDVVVLRKFILGECKELPVTMDMFMKIYSEK